MEMVPWGGAPKLVKRHAAIFCPSAGRDVSARPKGVRQRARDPQDPGRVSTSSWAVNFFLGLAAGNHLNFAVNASEKHLPAASAITGASST